MQGNKIAKVKPKSVSKWQSSIIYNVQPKSSIEINVEIQWDRDGLDELTFFPLDHTSPIDRYNGGNLSTFRYFVLDNDIVIDREFLTNQSFKLDSAEEIDNQSIFPIPNWVDDNGKAVQYIVKQGKLLTKDSVSGLKLDPVPYNTELDILLLDEKEGPTILFQKVKVKKGEPTFIYLSSETLNDLLNSNSRQFLMIVNNRGLDLLVDTKALDLGLKPFSTTYQSIIEFYKENY